MVAQRIGVAKEGMESEGLVGGDASGRGGVVQLAVGGRWHLFEVRIFAENLFMT